MDFLLQIWAGGLYLLNKIFLSLAEGRQASAKRTLRIVGWVVYILGVPAWVFILAGKHNWIAASIEAGGVPAMLFGLYNVYRSPARPSILFDRFASFCTYAFLVIGLCSSLYENGGITTVSQTLELGVMAGFLVGSYLLAKKNYYGWLFFMLMNGSMASLMALQGKPLLTIQQLISLGFVIYGFIAASRSSREEPC